MPSNLMCVLHKNQIISQNISESQLKPSEKKTARFVDGNWVSCSGKVVKFFGKSGKWTGQHTQKNNFQVGVESYEETQLQLLGRDCLECRHPDRVKFCGAWLH